MLVSVCLFDDLILGFCYSSLSLETGGFELKFDYQPWITSEPTNQVC